MLLEGAKSLEAFVNKELDYALNVSKNKLLMSCSLVASEVKVVEATYFHQCPRIHLCGILLKMLS